MWNIMLVMAVNNTKLNYLRVKWTLIQYRTKLTTKSEERVSFRVYIEPSISPLQEGEGLYVPPLAFLLCLLCVNSNFSWILSCVSLGATTDIFWGFGFNVRGWHQVQYTHCYLHWLPLHKLWSPRINALRSKTSN